MALNLSRNTRVFVTSRTDAFGNSDGDPGDASEDGPAGRSTKGGTRRGPAAR